MRETCRGKNKLPVLRKYFIIMCVFIKNNNARSTRNKLLYDDHLLIRKIFDVLFYVFLKGNIIIYKSIFIFKNIVKLHAAAIILYVIDYLLCTGMRYSEFQVGTTAIVFSYFKQFL